MSFSVLSLCASASHDLSDVTFANTFARHTRLPCPSVCLLHIDRSKCTLTSYTAYVTVSSRKNKKKQAYKKQNLKCKKLTM